MKSEYNYFVSYSVNSKICSTTIQLEKKLNTSSEVSELVKELTVNYGSANLCLINFILLSETHDPEKSDDKKDFLTDLHELFTKYDVQIEADHYSTDVSICMGDKFDVTTESGIIDTSDINYAILNL